MRRAITVAVVLVAALAATGAVLYSRNATPVVPTLAPVDAATPGAP